jgi:hypothetical protein
VNEDGTPDLENTPPGEAEAVRESDIQLRLSDPDMNTRQSAVSLDSGAAAQERRNINDAGENTISAPRMFCNALKYYHRVLSVFFGCPAEESWSRSIKAVVCFT